MCALCVTLCTERPRELRAIGRDAIRILIDIHKHTEMQPIWKMIKSGAGEGNATTMMAGMLQTPTPAVYLKSR